MAIGTDIIKTTGRLIFELHRGEDEETERSIDIPYPRTDDESLQEAVNSVASIYSGAADDMNLLIQPANWRDVSDEDVWTTTGLRYEIVTTTTTPITPDTPVTVGSAQENQTEEHHDNQDQQG